MPTGNIIEDNISGFTHYLKERTQSGKWRYIWWGEHGFEGSTDFTGSTYNSTSGHEMFLLKQVTMHFEENKGGVESGADLMLDMWIDAGEGSGFDMRIETDTLDGESGVVFQPTKDTYVLTGDNFLMIMTGPAFTGNMQYKIIADPWVDW